MKLKRRHVLIPVYVLVLFEVFARLALRVQPLSTLDHEVNWRRLWTSKRVPTGVDTYFGFDVYDSKTGWRSKPDVTDMRVFGDRVLNTNSRGFRGRDEYAEGEHSGSRRIMILGDSFTFGDGLSDDQTYPHHLQKLMPESEVMNLGVHGYGHDQMLVLVKEEAPRYRPDVVILGYVHMDIERNVLNFRDYAKPKFILDDGQLVLTGTPVPSPEETIRWDWARPRTMDLLTIVRHRFRVSSGEYAVSLVMVTTAILAEMSRFIESVGAIPVFVYLPYGDEVSTDGALTHGEQYFFSVCATSAQLKCFSTRPYFAEKLAEGVKLPQGPGHWDATMHQLAAEAMHRELAGQGPLAVRH